MVTFFLQQRWIEQNSIFLPESIEVEAIGGFSDLHSFGKFTNRLPIEVQNFFQFGAFILQGFLLLQNCLQ